MALKPHWASVNPPAAWCGESVVATGDQLPLDAADPREPRASRLPIARSLWPEMQRRDQRQHRGQIRGQVDVAVGQHACVAVRPGPPQGAAATLVRHPQPGDVVEVAVQLAHHLPGAVGAGIVGNGDPERAGQRPAQMLVQPAHARAHGPDLVVDGNDDVEDGRGGLAVRGQPQHAVRGGVHERCAVRIKAVVVLEQQAHGVLLTAWDRETKPGAGTCRNPVDPPPNRKEIVKPPHRLGDPTPAVSATARSRPARCGRTPARQRRRRNRPSAPQRRTGR